MNLFIISLIATAILGVLAIGGYIPAGLVAIPLLAYALQLFIVSFVKAYKQIK